ncbi:uncharacterized protein LOC128214392 [Mya arenaria]|uniref:uncharacterized protein LOC128214392 n=1 Tax=Mya arenaria TaxID=6604 RepID=UPI0022E5C4C6|nr:uncharacterized protein LOC128214392 [Mya arenaria]
MLNTAEGGTVDYELVDQEEQLQSCLDEIKQAVSNGKRLALDCEGESLSRDGKMQLLTIATRGKSYILDIQKLKALPFERGLRALLEDKNVMKLMFDCRGDADALFHQFHVKLDGVLDIQLLEIMKRPEFACKPINRKRSDNTVSAIRLSSLLGCIEEYVKSDDMVKQKREGMDLQNNWTQRPLTTEQMKYAKTDVLSLFRLFDHFNPDDEEKTRLEIASQIYVDLKRSIPARTYNEFENNKYLPVDIIPDKGSSSFPKGNVSCTECYRQFPGDEFSKKQLKMRKQMCRTCKAVKRDKDVHQNRLANFERAEREESVDYYESDEYNVDDDDGDEW